MIDCHAEHLSVPFDHGVQIGGEQAVMGQFWGGRLPRCSCEFSFRWSVRPLAPMGDDVTPRPIPEVGRTETVVSNVCFKLAHT